MSAADRARWDARYAGSNPPDEGPSAVVVGSAPLLPGSGTALDLACGTGESLVWLAGRGLRCTGIDLSPVGLERARARADGAGVDIDWREADLDDWDPRDQQWDVVLCQRFLVRDLVPRIRRAVRPGGLLLMEVLASGSYAAEPNELLRWFVDWRVIRYVEEPAARPVATLVARRP